MRIVIVILMFLVFGALLIISNNSLAMYKPENTQEFSELYVSWLNQLYLNAQSVTGYVINQDWVPGDVNVTE